MAEVQSLERRPTNRHYNICEATTLTCILAGRVRSGSADSDRTCRPSHPACIDIRLASHTDCSPLLHGQHTFNRWRMVVSGTWKYDEPEVENVTRGRGPSVTFLTSGRPISTSHERLCVICFVVWPNTRILNYKWLTVAKREWVSSAI